MSLSSAVPDRVLLSVSRVAFYPDTDQSRCPEDICFPSCMRACLEFLGDLPAGCDHVPVAEPGCSYAYLMGVSGAAFKLTWRPGWHGDNVELMYLSEDPYAPFDRAFEAVGYEYEILFKQKDRDCSGVFRRRIVESLNEGRPVLGFGIIGPPECTIISGYDEGGDVLMGWSFFQSWDEGIQGIEFEPTGEFRVRDWYERLSSPIFFGAKRAVPPPGVLYRDALSWGVEVMRTPAIYRYDDVMRHNGLAAYDAWAEHLTHDDELTADDMAVLSERFSVHDDAVSQVAEGRWYGAIFLRQIAAAMPDMADDLNAAAECFVAEHDLMWKAWEAVGGNGHDEAKVRAFAEPDVRRKIISIIEQARDKDAEAADHIEDALEQ